MQKARKKSVQTKKTWLIVAIVAGVLVIAGVVLGIVLVTRGSDRGCGDDTPGVSDPNDPELNIDYKPIIYLYPEQETVVNVTLGNSELITVSYPHYGDEGWQVLAKPSGELTDLSTNRQLYALYWEGKDYLGSVREDGFIVDGKDTASFLEEKLAILGLSEREADEFIIYWLPKLEPNEYNYIRFATTAEIEQYMPLQIVPRPDSVIRVYMEYMPLAEKYSLPEQQLTTLERQGFVAVEWGGSQIGGTGV